MRDRKEEQRLKRLTHKRNLIFIMLVVVLVIPWVLTLILGDGKDKVKILVLSFILPFVVYGLVRWIYRIVSKNATEKAMNRFFCFFFIMGMLGTLMMLVEYIVNFPNGLSPTLSACVGIVMATLDKAKKQDSSV